MNMIEYMRKKGADGYAKISGRTTFYRKVNGEWQVYKNRTAVGFWDKSKNDPSWFRQNLIPFEAGKPIVRNGDRVHVRGVGECTYVGKLDKGLHVVAIDGCTCPVKQSDIKPIRGKNYDSHIY